MSECVGKFQIFVKIRLGGHGAAAIALWWLEEGSKNGFHFDQAVVNFEVVHALNLLTWSCRRFLPR